MIFLWKYKFIFQIPIPGSLLLHKKASEVLSCGPDFQSDAFNNSFKELRKNTLFKYFIWCRYIRFLIVTLKILCTKKLPCSQIRRFPSKCLSCITNTPFPPIPNSWGGLNPAGHLPICHIVYSTRNFEGTTKKNNFNNKKWNSNLAMMWWRAALLFNLKKKH